ncbi:MAG: nucleotidyltransferase family protein [Lachnospiraceae bacterium]
MKEGKYEARYLIALLAAVINDKKAPVSGRKPNWENVYRLADFHNVANVVYYGILGLNDDIPGKWRNKFCEKYQDAVLENERLQNAIGVLLWQMERHKIHCVFLKGDVMSHYYLHPEMRMVKELEILVERGKERQISKMMATMDYTKTEDRRHASYRYYKVPGVSVVFYNHLGLVHKKMKQYFGALLQRLLIREGYQYVHEFNHNEFYIYLIGNMVKNYACAELDIQQMLDLYVYYSHYRQELNWNYIEKELGKMKIQEFAERLLVLSEIWFSGETSEEIDIYEAMEAYILTKGIEGREESSKLLPLIKQVADFYERDRKKEWIKAQLKWMFPNRGYMQTLYPCLQKFPFLIIICWVLRLLRSLGYAIKSRIKKIMIYIYCGVNGAWNSLKERIKEMWNTIFKKKNENQEDNIREDENEKKED